TPWSPPGPWNTQTVTRRSKLNDVFVPHQGIPSSGLPSVSSARFTPIQGAGSGSLSAMRNQSGPSFGPSSTESATASGRFGRLPSPAGSRPPSRQVPERGGGEGRVRTVRGGPSLGTGAAPTAPSLATSSTSSTSSRNAPCASGADVIPSQWHSFGDHFASLAAAPDGAKLAKAISTVFHSAVAANG